MKHKKGEKTMKGLTKQEIEILMEAEDILFLRLDGELEEIFSDSAIELHKAIRKYVKLTANKVKSDNDKAIEKYIKSDIKALNDLYNEK